MDINQLHSLVHRKSIILATISADQIVCTNLPKEKYPEITEDLILTGCHCILTETITDKERAGIIDVMKDVYVTDRKYRLPACVDERATPYQVEGVFSIWHLALEHDDMYMNYGIYANGLLVETTSKRMISQYSGMKLIEN